MDGFEEVLNWVSLRQALISQLMALVQDAHQERPDDDLYGATVHEFLVDAGRIW